MINGALYNEIGMIGENNSMVEEIMRMIMEYGGIGIFILVLLEYMNLPGFPAGIIMPLAGVWAVKTDLNFLLVMIITVVAGLLGSWLLYLFGRKGGDVFLANYLKKFPKHKEVIERKMEFLRVRGSTGIFISKLIPMVRTLISIPAGIIKMNFITYTASSLMGITVWNLVFVGGGYVMGEAMIALLI